MKEEKALYTDRDVRGLGKNYMLEDSRKSAIGTYTFYIRYYALLGLMKQLEAGASAAALPATKTKDARWEHERAILAAEFGADAKPAELLAKLGEAVEKIAVDTQVSKEKDDNRGARVIDDYPHAHKPAAEDKFVKQTWAETRELQAKIKMLVGKLGK